MMVQPIKTKYGIILGRDALIISEHEMSFSPFTFKVKALLSLSACEPEVSGESNWYSYKPAVNAVTNNQPIPFSNGRPDFSPWSKGSITFVNGVLDGTEKDFPKVYKTIAKEKGITQSAAPKLLRKINQLHTILVIQR